MNILLVTQSLGKGGAERLALELAHCFLKKPGIRLCIVSLSEENEFPELSKGLVIRYCNSNVHLSLSGKSTINIKDYEMIVDDFQPDVIHSHTYEAELVSRENIRPGIVYVTHVHNDFPELEPFKFSALLNKTKLTRYYERLRMFRKYKAANNTFITISSLIDTNLKRQLPSSWHHKIYLVPNGVDLKKFNRNPGGSSNKINDSIQLINIGRFFPVKNQRYLIDVLEHLTFLSSEHSFHLTFIGDGPERNEVLNYADMKGLADKISSPGLVNDPENYLKHSTIYVHSAIHEPFGLVIIEAMAAGLPVLSLNGGGNADLIHDGENGVLLSSNTSPIVFAEHILNLLNDPELYQSMTINAYKSAQHFSIEVTADELIKIYNDCKEVVN
jgi:glycosyltransferase involved in cell wall biosynthesis